SVQTRQVRVRNIFREDHNDRIAANVRTTPVDLTVSVEHDAVGLCVASCKPGVARKSLCCAGIDHLSLGELLASDAADQPGVSVEFVVQPLEQVTGSQSRRAPAAMKCPAVDTGGHVADDVWLHAHSRWTRNRCSATRLGDCPSTAESQKG